MSVDLSIPRSFATLYVVDRTNEECRVTQVRKPQLYVMRFFLDIIIFAEK